MALSIDLISQFVEVTKNDKDDKKESTVYGTVTMYNGKQYVKLDGSDLLTPVLSTTVNEDGERVIVTIKDHTATITGNVSNPSASNGQVLEIGSKISEFEIIVADKVSVKEFDAQVGRIDELTADNVTIKDKLTASEAEIENLKLKKLDADVADIKYATIENLEATNLDVRNLEADYGDFKVLTTEKFTAQDAAIKNLDVGKLSVEDAKIIYANIDFANIGKAAIENFFSKSGMIGDLVVGDGTITGTLVGVTIKGDLIEGGTVKADKLVVQGEDGLYYKLNVTAETVAAEQTEYNSLSGSIITAKSITAEKISVNDLVAFDATIGGFNITEDSIYSGVKETVDNTTRGIYMDDEGQFAIGDANNFLRYYKDESTGEYKLEISPGSIEINADEIVQKVTSELKIGGRNLIVESTILIDKGIGVSGNVDTYADHVCTELINASGNSNYILTVYGGVEELEHGGTPYVTVGFYNEDQTFISSPIMVSSWEYGKSWKVTSPKNSAYARVSFPNFLLQKIKFEKGEVSTDWSPAPEDVQSGINNAQSKADEANSNATAVDERVTISESTIQQLADSISMLVTDDEGNSMMTQTADGWRFDISQITESLNDAATQLNDMAGKVNEVDSAIQSVKDLTDDLASKTAYIVMTTDDTGAPCIELGKTDNPFKVRITNTSVDFMDGSSRIAYVSNQALYIERAVIKNELQIGEGNGFVWKKRSNGNMGLRYVGG